MTYQLRKQLGIRWTLGDVTPLGFEALRLSVWGAYRIWGRSAAYGICVNTIPLERAQELTGDLPDEIRWHSITAADLPELFQSHLDERLSEGVGWRFAPLRLFPDRYELSLDIGCILWRLPSAIRRWLADAGTESCLFAEDVLTRHGQFDCLCGPEPCNSGLCGLPPGFDLGDALITVLQRQPVRLVSELDEQGLQAAALSLRREPLMVRLEEVTVCSPFPPHLPYLGACGAHFVGLNASQPPWQLDGRAASEYVKEHWLRHRDRIYTEVGIKPSLNQRRWGRELRITDSAAGVVGTPRLTPSSPPRPV